MKLQMLEQKTEHLKNQLKQMPHSWSEVPAIVANTLNHISVAAKPCFNQFIKHNCDESFMAFFYAGSIIQQLPEQMALFLWNAKCVQ